MISVGLVDSRIERRCVIALFALVMILSSVFLSSDLNVSSAQDTQVGVESGDWIDYELNWTDPPSPPYAVWIRNEILAVNGSIITVEKIQKMSDGSVKNKTKTGDVAEGTGAAALIFIPPNLERGNLISVEGFGQISIDDEYQKTYLGKEHAVLFSDFEEKGFHVIVYWDKETGVALEMHTQQLTRNGITQIVGSNIWNSDSLNGDDGGNNLIWLGVLLFVIVMMSTVLFRGKRHKSSKRSKKQYR